ncbi:MAG TPA: protein-disulfide reductase DsbD [Burkholderiaceae bacterium]|nr:protein-disulfide reductase DsbD [Burkholderiaceae bacterium]
MSSHPIAFAQRLAAWLVVVLALMSTLFVRTAAAAQEEQFLEPEQAFRFSARAADDRHVEVLFQITPGYYMYRERLSVASPDASLGTVALPKGKVKFDETFQKDLETYRGELRFSVPVDKAPASFALNVVSQGCADAGLCYPPMTSIARVSLAAFGGDGSVRVQPAAADAGALAPPAATVATAGTAATGAGGSEHTATSWLDGSGVDSVLKSGRFWLVVGAFFVMGVALSFTPCVLPMLPILSSIIAGSAAPVSRGRALTLAASYSLGMALVYAGLGVAAGLAGEGLAARLQSPPVLALFALMLSAFALSMFDVYELRMPSALTARMTAHSQRLPTGQLAGVFAMGAISALIVSPCVSAPLAGALVFISQTRDVALGGTALFSLAAGMSVPLLVVGGSAGDWLPKSGPWMTSVKRAFGVLLFAVAIWIVQPVLAGWAVLGAWGLLLLVAGFMLRPFDAQHGSHAAAPRTWLKQAFGMIALILGALQIVGAASGGTDPLRPLSNFAGGAGGAGADGVRFRPVRSSAELDGLLRSADRPVMLDFYADWCVSCKEMERFTFSDPLVAKKMSGALLLKADVTANSADDRELLKRFHLFGPPGTIFFDAQGREIGGLRVVGFQNAERFTRTLQAAGL